MQSVTQLPVKKEAVAPEAAEPTRHPLVSLRREMDRLFDDFASGWPSWPLGRRLFEPRLWRDMEVEVNQPVVDVSETAQEYLISAELPGIEEKDIEVTLSDESITIKGEKKQEKEESGKGYQLSERSYGLFERSFGLPAGVDTAKISAQFSKGVLKLTLPKTAEAQRKQPKRIEVKSA